MKKIVDAMNVIYNKKVAEKKGAATAGKKPKKPANKAMSSNKGYDPRNNQMGVTALVGSDDEYGGEYGEESNPNAERIKDDEEYDFFWA